MTSLQQKPLYTWLTVSVNQTHILAVSICVVVVVVINIVPTVSVNQTSIYVCIVVIIIVIVSVNQKDIKFCPKVSVCSCRHRRFHHHRCYHHHLLTLSVLSLCCYWSILLPFFPEILKHFSLRGSFIFIFYISLLLSSQEIIIDPLHIHKSSQ